MRIISLTILLLGGIIIGSLRGQQPQQMDGSSNEWIAPELPDSFHAQLCHKDFLRFWRIRTHGEKGNWHLYNEEDKGFLSRWKEKVEWTAIEGRLPK